MPKTYPQRIFKCKQLSIVGRKVKCAPEQAQASYAVQHGQINQWLQQINRDYIGKSSVNIQFSIEG